MAQRSFYSFSRSSALPYEGYELTRLREVGLRPRGHALPRNLDVLSCARSLVQHLDDRVLPRFPNLGSDPSGQPSETCCSCVHSAEGRCEAVACIDPWVHCSAVYLIFPDDSALQIQFVQDNDLHPRGVAA
jgi:hypothetical protein